MTAAAPRRAGRGRTRDIRLTVRVRAPANGVYRALTSARELCRWWLQGAETDARNAGRFRMVWPRLRGGAGRGAFPPHVAMGETEGFFVDLEPGRKVAWMWRLGRRPPFPPLASFFIRKLRSGCEVTILHAGFGARAGRAYEGCSLGWEDCLAKLKRYLETGESAKGQVLSLKKKSASLG